MMALIAQTSNQVDILTRADTISPIANIGQLIQIGADAVFLVGTIAVLVYLLLGAFKWITAGGEKGKIEEARNMMTQAVIGVVLLAAVFAIYSLVLTFIGLDTRINITGGGGNTAPTNNNGNAPLPGGGGGPILPNPN